MSFDLFTNEQNATLLNAARHPSMSPEASTWDGFASGAGKYAMRSLAEVGRAVDMAGAVFPIMADKITGGTAQQDQYFSEHDAVFNNAVDHWTPRPGEVGAAGQIAGQLAGGVMQAIVSPALLVGTTQLSSAEDLVREGVDSTTAQIAGGIQGVNMAVGIKLPYLGKTLATRLLSGSGGNLLQGTAGAFATSEVLKGQGYEQQAERYNPWDLRTRALDVMLGAAFGGLAHISSANTDRSITPQQDYQRYLAETGLTEQRIQEMMAAEKVAPFPPGSSKIEKGPSKLAGEGMFASDEIGAGGFVAPVRVDGLRTPAGRYTNHSNNPNVEFRRNSNGDLDAYAIHPIKAGDEVFVNYRQAGEVNIESNPVRNLSPTDEAAILVANQARHMEDATPQGRPATDADATRHADAMRQAVDQVLRGESVTVDATVKGMHMIPDEAQHRQRVEVMDEAQRIAAQEVPAEAPIVTKMDPNPQMAEGIPLDHDPAALMARRTAADYPDMTIPTTRTADDGSTVTIKASDAIAMADAEVAHARSTAANIFKTAANCLIGAL